MLGDYGYGKSHIVELAGQDALQRDFLVAAASLDLQELPAHRAFDIYGALMRNLRYPDERRAGDGPVDGRGGGCAPAARGTAGAGRGGRRSPGRGPLCPGQHLLLSPAASLGKLDRPADAVPRA